jgi:hypothetical protein
MVSKEEKNLSQVSAFKSSEAQLEKKLRVILSIAHKRP